MSDPKFNQNEPYGEIFGAPGVRYQQGGHMFSPKGEYVPEIVEQETRKEKLSRIARDKAERRAKFQEEVRNGTAVTVIEGSPKTSPSNPLIDFLADNTPVPLEEKDEVVKRDLSDIHWATLKKMVEEKGGTYQGKEQAVRFLSSGA